MYFFAMTSILILIYCLDLKWSKLCTLFTQISISILPITSFQLKLKYTCLVNPMIKALPNFKFDFLSPPRQIKKKNINQYWRAIRWGGGRQPSHQSPPPPPSYSAFVSYLVSLLYYIASQTCVKHMLPSSSAVYTSEPH